MDTVTVSPSHMEGWSFAEEVTVGEGGFEEGPAGATGAGSARLVVDAVGRETLSTTAFDGTAIADFVGLTYRTYQDADSPGSAIYAVSLQFDVDYDGTDAEPGPQSRMVYEPYYQATVVKGEWQAWDARASTWWAVKPPGSALCPQSAPCAYDDFVAAFPHAVVRGALVLKAGGPWAPGFSGNVDDLVLTFADGTTRAYDFEPDGATDTGGDSGAGDSGEGDDGGDSADSGASGDSGGGEPDVSVTCDGCGGSVAGGGRAGAMAGLFALALARFRRRSVLPPVPGGGAR